MKIYPSENAQEIFDLATLLGVLLAGPDADTTIDGIHRVVTTIRARAGELLRENIDAAAKVE
ncbi:hypothetical protein JQ620_15805 [Bradyrhizobium sp. AUGA SZCCT0274]|uniref:hypothetical protein n=1 Tax=Bradyrhizobium sp. AUGA SZCCT0274 TaxID=2807670 RepID=UPI001BA4C077|nr:hypothetical protein [Bradyrhizobium sp. AUGA SZCCT0274]MBR1241594.1 hypothetical protein [Bradyrhizobium sp. AUGA SZCCT0274]